MSIFFFCDIILAEFLVSMGFPFIYKTGWDNRWCIHGCEWCSNTDKDTCWKCGKLFFRHGRRSWKSSVSSYWEINTGKYRTFTLPHPIQNRKKTIRILLTIQIIFTMDDRNDYKCKKKIINIFMYHVQLNLPRLYCCSCHSPGNIFPSGSIFVFLFYFGVVCRWLEWMYILLWLAYIYSIV